MTNLDEDTRAARQLVEHEREIRSMRLGDQVREKREQYIKNKQDTPMQPNRQPIGRHTGDLGTQTIREEFVSRADRPNVGINITASGEFNRPSNSNAAESLIAMTRAVRDHNSKTKVMSDNNKFTNLQDQPKEHSNYYSNDFREEYIVNNLESAESFEEMHVN